MEITVSDEGGRAILANADGEEAVLLRGVVISANGIALRISFSGWVWPAWSAWCTVNLWILNKLHMLNNI